MFIAFEGGEGAGKSTQIGLLAEMLRNEGYAVTATREPGSTEIGKKLRQMLLWQEDGRLARKTEALLYAADRAEHVDKIIRPALDRGDVVVTDRYIDSSLAYQGAGSGLYDPEIPGGTLLRDISLWAADDLIPDLTILLDVDHLAGLTRVGARGQADVWEMKEETFHIRLRRRFLELAAADPGRYCVIDASRSVNVIAEQAWAEVQARLGPACTGSIIRAVS